MDRCSYGEDDDGGVGEGGIMAEKTKKWAALGCRAAAQGAPPAPAGHHGGAPPLSPLPPWLLGAIDEPSPMEMRCSDPIF